MTAWARAGWTAASTSRLARRSAPPLRGCGVDRLSPAQQGLAKRLWLKVSASAPFVTDLPGRKRVPRDRDRPFVRVPRDAMLSGCPDRAPAWALCPTIFTSDWSLGPTSAGRPSMMLPRGPSPTIGPGASRSQRPKLTYSRHGSATSSMSCSGRADDLTRRLLP
jgi:hypothetical protein